MAELQNVVGIQMATLILDIWNFTTQQSRLQFQNGTMNIGGQLLGDNDFRVQLVAQQNVITFAQMMHIIDQQTVNWMNGMYKISNLANRFSNAARLEQLHELGLRQLRNRAVTTPPPVYSQSKHISLNNFVATAWKYWCLQQGFDQDFSIIYFALAFNDKERSLGRQRSKFNRNTRSEYDITTDRRVDCSNDTA